jgi:4-amino-4-deoxy-L-arabinose transferase-like glycosyltransferase
MAWLLAGSAVLYSWNLTSTGMSDYYATAAKSMALSWRAFFFGAFDPNSTITLDKLSGFLLPQALSVRIFGFSPWALAFPQVLEGLVTIAVTYYVVRRWIGPVGGLIAATVLAFTPLLVSMFSHPMEDSMLTMFTVLAIGFWQRNIESGKLRYLLLAAAMVGLGFQAKMMQSWLVLPAMAIVFFVMNPGRARNKLFQLAKAGLVVLGISLSWMTAISLVPAGHRPYIDGTTDNNIFSMVFGYNGINHFIQNFFPGALGADPSAIYAAGGSQPLILKLIDHTPFKLLFPEYASQIGWLYPLAAAGLVLGLVELRGRRGPVEERRNLRSGILFNTTLLLTLAIVLGLMSLPHTAYLASMAFPLATLSAIGALLLWRASRRTASRWRFALPVAVAVQTAWSIVLLSNFPDFARWMSPPIAILGAASTIALFLNVRRGSPMNRSVIIAVSAALGLGLLGPIVWSLSTLNPAFAGSANDAYAGPRPTSIFNPASKTSSVYGSGLNSNRVTTYTASVEDRIYDYALARSSAADYVIATDAWRSAAPMIMDEAQKVLPIGGYTSRVPSPTVAQIKKLVLEHDLSYVLLTGQASKNSYSTPIIAQLHQWVTSSCRLVPAQIYDSGGMPGQSQPPDRLYDCATRRY